MATLSTKRSSKVGWAAALALSISTVACGGADDTTSGGGAGAAGGASTSGTGGGDTGSGGTSAGGSGGSGGGGVASLCDAPIAAVDTSQPTTVVGTGAGTCTEAALENALKTGGIITFDRGGAATITLTSQKELLKNKDTVIDGGGKITLDGGGTTRLFHFDGGDFRKTTTVVTLQHLAITGAHASGSKIPDALP